MAPDRVFYDGTCGFCHRAVLFLLARDARGDAFRFAPLQGETYRRCRAAHPEAAHAVTRPSPQHSPAFERAARQSSQHIPAPEGAGGDTLWVLTARGEWLARSAAVLHLLRRLPAPWPALAALAARLPRALRDHAYDAFARRRHWFFRRAPAHCPALPAAQRARFDD